MTVIRLGVILLFAATLTSAQDSPAPVSVGSHITEPKLPFVDRDACPRALVVGWKIEKDVQVYSSWEERSELRGTLKAGEKVNVLTGVDIIREPDRTLVTQPFGQPSLEPGDLVLRYGMDADWYWKFWSKGVWFKEYQERVVEKSGSCTFQDERSCPFKVVQNGVKEWWVQVKHSDLNGWVLVSKYTDPDVWTPRNAFQGLCAQDIGGD